MVPSSYNFEVLYVFLLGVAVLVSMTLGIKMTWAKREIAGWALMLLGWIFMLLTIGLTLNIVMSGTTIASG